MRIVWSFRQQKESHRVTPPVQSENMHLNREIIIPKYRFDGKCEKIQSLQSMCVSISRFSMGIKPIYFNTSMAFISFLSSSFNCFSPSLSSFISSLSLRALSASGESIVPT